MTHQIRKRMNLNHKTTTICLLTNCLLALTASLAAGMSHGHYQQSQSQSQNMFAARRAADDSRPLIRAARAEPQDSGVVMGKFKAPAPDRIFKHRVPKSSDFGSQILSASFRVADVSGGDQSASSEKVVNGMMGASVNKRTLQQREPRERQVSAKIMVSDEGLNYPPSKLSADIHGNVAEIVTAPPEAVDSDFLVPQVSKLYGARRFN